LAQTARVQLIHNAPDPTVDVYVNGLKALDDFAFRTATNFINLPAGLPLQVAIAPENSTSAADAIATFNLTLESGKTYAVTASGLVGDPNTPFTLIIDDAALEAAGDPNKVDVNVLHGSPDAPPVDVVVRTGGKIVANLAYGKFTPYLSVAPGVYYLDIKPAGTDVIVQTYLADLTGLAGQSIRVVASGLLGGAPAFGLYAVTAGGAVVELPASPVARVQVIHNAIAPTVDVYANDALLIDDFEFRTATPFIFVPAEVDIDLGIAPENSTSADDAIATFAVNLENGKTYIVTASGILGDLNTPFDLNINDKAREASDTTATVDIAVLHGSPNAPAVDVDAVFVANNVITDLAYGEFTPYLSLPPAKYDFAIRATGDPNVVASFRADLSGLGGGAAYVFASGLLGGDPGFGLFAALPNGTVIELPLTPTARLQVIHNSPDPIVDVYADNALVLDDFEFRTATPFIDFPADRDITLGVALPNSTSAADAIATFNVNLEEGKTYIVTASGIVGDVDAPFTLIVNDGGREAAADPNSVDIAVLHGSPNAPAVDVDAIFVANNVITDLAYGEFTPYLSLPPAVYDLAVRAAGDPNVVAAFRADLSGLAGGAAYVFASGLLGGTPAFGLFAALPTGDVIALPLTPLARVQVIHNSPSPTVDVYAGNTLLVDNFAFRTATPFIDFPAERDVVLGVALPNSTSASDAIATFNVNLEEGRTYVVTASGVVGSPVAPFTLIIDDEAREAALDPNNVDIAVLHGSPDAPPVDVDAVFVADNVITGLPYGSFTPYLSLPPAVYDFAVRPAGNPNVVASYRADLSSLAGGAAYVFASGLLSGTPGFGLFAALPNGVVVELPLTPTARVQVIHNSPEPTVDVYAGNSLLIKDFGFRTATPFVELPAARNFTLGIAPAGSTSAADAIFTQDVNLPIGGTLAVMAQGVVGNPTRPFTLVIDPAARETASPGAVALSVLHGSPDAPSVDVFERLAGPLVTNLAYGAFTGYLEVPADDNYYLDIKPAGVNQIVGTYRAELGSFGGQAIRVFASGFLSQAPGFGLFAALPDGNVIELRPSPVARVQVIHNSPAPTVDIYANGFLAFDDFEYLQATAFDYVPAGVPIELAVAPQNSTSVGDAFFTTTVTFENARTYYLVANGTGANFTILVNDQAREQAVNPVKIEFAVLHGSPNAPAVDVRSALNGSLVVSNLAFGQFTPYLALDPDLFIVDVTPAGNPATVVGTWGADLEGAEGLAGLVMATGLLGGTPEIDLVVVLPNGFVIGLAPLTRAQVIHNSPSPTVDVYLDDIRILDDFAFRRATPFVLLPAREPFTLSVAPGNSTSVNQAIYSLPIDRLETGKDYIIMAAGVVGSSTRPFQLYINEDGRRRSASPVVVDLALFHGSPDAPAVDVQIAGGPVVFDDIAFGQFSEYLSAPVGSYIIQVTPANDNTTIVQSYRADISTLGGQAAVVFASGFLSGTPGFEVWVALANGTTFPLPVFVRTNELEERLLSLQVAPNPAVHETWIRFELSEPTPLRYAVRDLTGRMLYEGNLGNLPAGPFAQRIEVGNLPSGMYQLELHSENSVQTRKFIVQRP
jgi:hypothetical protein